MSEQARWDDYRWSLVRGEPVAAPVNHALDEVLTRRVGAGLRQPTLRFWDRLEPEVVIGRFQSVRNEVDEAEARRYGIQVMRRLTGGGAMFVEPPNVITYSLYAPAGLVAGMSFVESYAFLDGWVVAALRSLGIDAWYEPINDITSSGGKIGGAAQARRFGAVLHHVTMSYDLNSDRMLSVLRIGQEKLSDKGIASAAKRVGPLRQQTDLPRDVIVARMIDTFARECAPLEEDEIGEEEMAEAGELIRTRYGTHDWTYVLP
ncbi:MAG TPA: biotin/lipoate A/B protein ligase family protein [Thermomicrobiaceae bacterium]|nr:biotin/lipoate A/B protein ligase family protein [Thermomicrobiaceae bacterium]